MRDRILAKLMVVLLRILARCPRWLARPITAILGRVLMLLMRRRRRIVLTNLRLCFADLSAAQHNRLCRQVFASLGYSVYEMALAWCLRDSNKLPACHISGLHLIAAAQAENRGIILVNGHFNCLEICSRYLAEAMPLAGVYRPLNNPYLEQFHTAARLRYATSMISKRNPRAILAALQQQQVIWFAPDQDFGPDRSIFIPFFNIPTATLTATWRLAKSTGAAVLTASPHRQQDGSYTICIESELPGVEDAGPERMLAALNQRIEAAVRQAPADYWWIHRRFKTTPDQSTRYD